LRSGVNGAWFASASRWKSGAGRVAVGLLLQLGSNDDVGETSSGRRRKCKRKEKSQPSVYITSPRFLDAGFEDAGACKHAFPGASDLMHRSGVDLSPRRLPNGRVRLPAVGFFVHTGPPVHRVTNVMHDSSIVRGTSLASSPLPTAVSYVACYLVNRTVQVDLA
jgi:hypothetical protein